MFDKYSKMKKASTRERKHSFGKDNEAPQADRGLSAAKRRKRWPQSGNGGSSQRKFPNFLANLERLGYTESEGAAFLKKFAHDAVL